MPVLLRRGVLRGTMLRLMAEGLLIA